MMLDMLVIVVVQTCTSRKLGSCLMHARRDPQLIRTGPVIGPRPRKERLYLPGRLETGLAICASEDLS
jgi:hypothetical protein